ncbi:hypothetical protein Y1Q_0011297 [Alligator mississippiensis]|uniref:Uncharacterized protein n=1 Tax=Alligator mississippiensis TaxID=8496 RepID=A0A151N903_ALLMI|nr:hypothetical protein Y1Q_0011297 [Alligator mississippiensis]
MVDPLAGIQEECWISVTACLSVHPHQQDPMIQKQESTNCSGYEVGSTVQLLRVPADHASPYRGPVFLIFL